MLKFILLVSILILFAFIAFWMKKFLFQKRAYGYPTTSQRVLAAVFDLIIINFSMVVAFLVYAVSKGELSNWVNDYIMTVKATSINRFYYDVRFFEFYSLVFFSIYSFFMEIIFTQSLGKKVMDIRIDYKSNKVLGSLVRNALKPFVIISWPIFLLISNCNKKGKWLHDWLSKAELMNEIKTQ